ncbi:hypothetical protein SCHPADRAFT_942962 [Schizopora paradoxa]|uniref:Uncharacterized protein n=1 Tax=Schizopora paradoxa TaxID=27342 RepID=A0A0H2REP8_9AGAM|nr:hypothetical protein SCHPADRAFT_942962 [Schizopora paradoxa]
MSSPSRQAPQPSMSFNTYCTVPPSTLYSTEYFRSLTFADVETLRLPAIAPEGTLTNWVHVVDSPPDWTVELDDLIPHGEDIRPVLNEMEAQYGLGKRGVVLQLRQLGKNVHVFATYGKLRIFQNINNSVAKVQGAIELFQTLRSTRSLPGYVLDRFATHPIFAPVSGLRGSGVSLWELTYLNDEQWVHEDTLNALGELAYLEQAVRSKTLPPKFLFLPTSFFAHLDLLYSEGLPLSATIHELRRRVVATNVEAIGFLVLVGSHFSAVWVDSTGVYTADSLEATHGPPPHLIDMLKWAFGGTPLRIANVVTRCKVPQQTSTMGNGSCGIASHNFVYRRAFGNVLEWDPNRSSHFRIAASVKLVLHC